MSEEIYHIAVFPIPGLVAFPGQVQQLHVLEPRYREMISHCISEGRLLGISLPSRVIRAASSDGDSINSSVAHYEASNILTCGEVQLVETKEDGRMIVQAFLSHKVEILSIEQHMPYYIARVRHQPDRPVKQEQAAAVFELLKYAAGNILDKKLSFNDQELRTLGDDRKLRAMLLWILSWFGFESDYKQSLLENNCEYDRAISVLRFLKAHMGRLGIPWDPPSSRRRIEGNLISVDFNEPRIS